MKTFEFAGFNAVGQKKVGIVKARNLMEAKRKVQREGIYVASIEVKDISVPSKGSCLFFRWLKELLC